MATLKHSRARTIGTGTKGGSAKAAPIEAEESDEVFRIRVSAAVERVRPPQWRKDVAKIGTRYASPDP